MQTKNQSALRKKVVRHSNEVESKLFQSFNVFSLVLNIKIEQNSSTAFCDNELEKWKTSFLSQLKHFKHVQAFSNLINYKLNKKSPICLYQCYFNKL